MTLVEKLHLKIAGTGIYLPKDILDNAYFESRNLYKYDKDNKIIKRYIGKNRRTNEKIIETTGVEERRKPAPEEVPSEMGYRAAAQALENAKIDPGSLVEIIVGTVTEKRNVPSAACKIQEKLGARGSCLAYDIDAGCAGFAVALDIANSRVLTKPGNYLVIAVEDLPSIVSYKDLNSTLFGGGAGAAILTSTDDNKIGIKAAWSWTDPHDGKKDQIFRDKKLFLRMPDGNVVFKEAVKKMPKAADIVQKMAGWDKVDVYIPHQANGRIIDSIAERVSKKGSIVYKNIEKYGNMSSATCAVALHEALEDKTIKEGSRVVITTFGAGLAISAVAIQF